MPNQPGSFVPRKARITSTGTSSCRCGSEDKRLKKPKLGAAWAEHIFLDVVGYSKLAVESQAAVVKTLNRIVRESVQAHRLTSDCVIFIPVGDGMCIALLNVSQPYDIQMQVALGILKRLHEHNLGEPEPEERFQIRIGINADKDNVIVDINRHCNISGKGINEAARIMGKADGGQILVGNSVFETLKSHRKYLSVFKPYTAIVKWGLALPVYQFTGDGHPYINVDVPKAFQTPSDVSAQKGPKSGETAAALKMGGLKVRVEIGPPAAQVQWAKLAGTELRKPLTIMALIDTGASATIINPQVAVTCGLAQTGLARISSLGQISECPEYVGALRFPESSLKEIDPVRFIAGPLPGQDVACLLGRDVLARWRLIYDGKIGEVRIEE
jgi:class 3 adenylate cyclase